MQAYPLGQVGYLFEGAAGRIVIDPYLTDSVAEEFGPAFRRLTPPTLGASALTGVELVLLTHAHLDHTDPVSLAGIFHSSPDACFAAPYECHPILESLGIPQNQLKLVSAGDVWETPGGATIRGIPAAHTVLETDANGRSRFLGYHLETPGLSLYHAGDTVAHETIIESLGGLQVDYAFLPVNECNYFRSARGIVGNMSPREAFGMAELIGARCLVPTHWDLFSPNSVYPWEVAALHHALQPAFELRFMPCGGVYNI